MNRVVLRPCRDDDVPLFVVALNDWEIAQWLPGPPFPYSEADGLAFVAEVNRVTPPNAYAVADRATDTFMGTLGLARNGSVAELGYCLLPQYRGLGLMREAIGLLFETLDDGLETIFATVDRSNHPSIRLLEASGLRLVGEHRRESPNRQGNLVVLRFELAVTRPRPVG